MGLLAGKPVASGGTALVFFDLGCWARWGCIGVYSIFEYFQKRGSEEAQDASRLAAQPVTAGARATRRNAEADQWIREANARLAQSKAGAGIANLPLIFVTGDRGTAKTSTILQLGPGAGVAGGADLSGQRCRAHARPRIFSSLARR